MIDAPLSYTSIVLNRFYSVPFDCAVAGALTACDLPDLAACLAPRRLLYVSPVDQLMEPAAGRTVETELKFPPGVYESAGRPEYMKIRSGFNNMEFDRLVSWWKAE